MENVDMMAENTEINVSKKPRQSKDYSDNFKAENTLVQRGYSIPEDDVFGTGHECEKINENQTQEKCSTGRDERKSGMLFRKKNSNSSIHSVDSGYGSGKHKVVPISENDEENNQTDVNFK